MDEKKLVFKDKVSENQPLSMNIDLHDASYYVYLELIFSKINEREFCLWEVFK